MIPSKSRLGLILGVMVMGQASFVGANEIPEFKLALSLYQNQQWNELYGLHKTYESFSDTNEPRAISIRRNFILSVLHVYRGNEVQALESIEKTKRLIRSQGAESLDEVNYWKSALDLVEYDLEKIRQRAKAK
jgi:hypothetical protein